MVVAAWLGGRKERGERWMERGTEKFWEGGGEKERFAFCLRTFLMDYNLVQGLILNPFTSSKMIYLLNAQSKRERE